MQPTAQELCHHVRRRIEHILTRGTWPDLVKGSVQQANLRTGLHRRSLDCVSLLLAEGSWWNGCPPRRGLAMCKAAAWGASKAEGARIGFDLAKRVAHLHGAAADGAVAFRKTLSRAVACFPCRASALRGGDGCLFERPPLGPRDRQVRPRGTAHRTGLSEAVLLSARVRRREKAIRAIAFQWNDAVDTAALDETASRPTMRFVAVGAADRAQRAMLYCTGGSPAHPADQRWGHLAEHGRDHETAAEGADQAAPPAQTGRDGSVVLRSERQHPVQGAGLTTV